MKTIIKGKVLTHKLTLDNGLETVTNASGVEERKYVRKPKFKIEIEEEYQQIGEAISDDVSNIFIVNRGSYEYIRLDEKRKTDVEEKCYQHDIGANVIRVCHVIKRETEYVSGTEEELAEHLQDYKLQYVNDHEDLKTYVKVHNIDIESVELDDLIEVVRGKEKNKSCSLSVPGYVGSITINDEMISVPLI